jgi:hypothetical protein
MSAMTETAQRFFDACDTGKGWEGCARYCHAGATFSAQADALGGVTTLRMWPHMGCSGARTLGRVGRCRRRGSDWRRTTSTSWSSTVTGSVT